MKINVSEIPPQGLHLSEVTSSQEWDLNSQDITYTGDIKLEADVQRIGNNVNVHVKVYTERDVRCVRCLEKFHQTFSEEFNFNYLISDENQILDITERVREELILNFPLKPLCRKDCKGICPICGKNLNYESCECKSQYIKFHFKKED